ncbi:tandem-95 repeat protein, partial [Pseudorhodobacter sp. E13]|uniref:VCBS domain-containing protein n=1 Tax=Pseudorhodobacter sp. E13 TaxID=2487931 RepID=UPI000F8DA4E3
MAAINSVSLASPQDTYTAGESFNIFLTFDGPVDISLNGGSIGLVLDGGLTAIFTGTVTLVGTTYLQFTYVVQAGNEVSDVDVPAGSLILNGGATIFNAGTSTPANVTVPATDLTGLEVDAFAAAPAVALNTDAGTSGSDGLTNDSVVNVSLAADAVSWEYQINGGGWNTGTGTSFDLGATDGTFTVQVRQTDEVGNTSAITTQTYTIDKTLGDISATNLILDNDSGTPGDHVTKATSRYFQFEVPTVGVEVGDTLTLFRDGVAVLTRPIASGEAGTTILLDDIDSVVDGDYDYHVVLTDAAGNQSTSVTTTVTQDTTVALLAAPVLADGDDTGASDSDGVTNFSTVSIDVAFGPGGAVGDTVTLVIDSIDFASVVLDSAAIMAGKVTFAGVPLTEGSHVLEGRTVDAAGNTLISTTGTVVLDTVEPIAPTITVADPVSVSGTDIDITGIPGDAVSGTVTLTDSMSNVVTYTLTAGDLSAGSVSLDASDFANFNTLVSGQITVSVDVKDIAGNAGTGVSAFELDISADEEGATLSVSFDDGDGFINAADAGVGLALTVDGLDSDATGTLVVTSSGGGSVSVAVNGNDPIFFDSTEIMALSDGVLTATLTVADDVGNSATATSTITLDTTAPATPTLTVASDSAIGDEDGILNDATPIVTIQAEAGSTVQVFNGGTLVGTATETAEPGVFTLTPTLADGLYNLSAVATDAAGNAATSAAVPVEINALDPEVYRFVNGGVPVTVTGPGTKGTGTATERADGAANENIGNVTATGQILFEDVPTGVAHIVGVSPITPNAPGLFSAALTTSATVANSGKGMVTWTFSVADSTLDGLGQGDTASFDYAVTIIDNDGNSSQVTVTVTVSGTNDVPVVTVNPVNTTVSEIAHASAQAISATGVLNISDADVGKTFGAQTTDADILTAVAATDATATLDGGAVPAAIMADVAGLLAAGNLTFGGPTAANAGSPQIAYTYSTTAALDFLAEGEVLVLTYMVQVNDGTANSVAKPLTVTITGTNDAPQITTGPATFDTDETDGVLIETGSFSVEDLDVSDTVTAAVSVASVTGDAGPLTTANVASFLEVNAGNVIANTATTGTVNWTFTSLADTFDYLSEGDEVVITYNVTVTDSEGVPSAPQTVTVTVTGTNDQPVIGAGDIAASVSEDVVDMATELTASGTIAFSDIDLNDTFSVADTTGTITPLGGATVSTDLTNALQDPAAFVASVNGTDIDWNFTLDPSVAQYLADGESVQVQYEIDLTDSSAAANDSATQIVTITITGANDDPTITVGGMDSVSANLTETNLGLTADGTLSVEDIDVTDIVSGSTSFTSADASGGVVVPGLNFAAMFDLDMTALIGDAATTGTATWEFDSGSEAFNFLPLNETLTLTYAVEVQDGNGGTASIPVTITIAGTNDGATIAGNTGGSGTEDSGTPITGTATATDVDNPDNLFVAVTSGAATYGTFTVGANGDWAYTINDTHPDVDALNVGDSLSDSFTITSVDGTTATVNVTIDGANDAAIISGNLSGTGTEDSGAAITGTATAADVDNDDNTFQEVTSGSAAHGTFTVATNGAWTYTINDADPVVNALPDGVTLSDSFTITSEDGTTQTVNITITGANDVPTLNVAGITEIADQTEDTAFTVTVAELLEGWSDVDTDTVLTVNGVSVANATVTQDGDTYTITPDLNFNGTLTIDYNVNDGHGDTAATRTVQVLAVDDPDTIVTESNLNPAVLTPGGDLLIGSGIPGDNGSWVVATDAADAPGVEIGMNVSLRFTGGLTVDPQDPTGQTFVAPVGAAGGTPQDNTGTTDDDGWARWNFQVSVAADTDNDGGTLADFDYTFTISNLDASGTPTGSPILTFTMEDVAAAAASSAGAPGSPAFTAAYDAFLAGDLYQGSINFEWLFAAYSIPFDPAAPGYYEISIVATDKVNDSNVLDTHIKVRLNSDPVANADADATTLVEAGLDTDGMTVIGTDTTSGNVLGNDTDPDTLPTPDTTELAVTSVEFDGTTMAVTTAGPTMIMGVYGTLTINADGTWSYALDAGDSDALAAGETATEVFTYDIADLDGASSSSTLTLTITGSNDAPVITAQNGNSNGADLDETNAPNLTANGTFDVSDVDLTDEVVVAATLVSSTTDISGTLLDVDGEVFDLADYLSAAQIGDMLTLTATDPVIDNMSTSGTVGWTFDSGTETFDFLPDGAVLTLVYDITVSDGNGGTATEQVTITVTGAADGASITGDIAQTITEGVDTDVDTSVTGDLSVTDPDFAQNGVQPANLTGTYGTFEILADGSWTYTIDNDRPATQALTPGSTPTEVFNVVSIDGSANQNVTITVNGANDSPFVTGQAGDSGATELADTDGDTTPATLTGTIDFSDHEINDIHTVVVVPTGPTAASYIGSLGSGFLSTATGSGSGQVQWTFTYNDAELDGLGEGETIVQTYSIQIRDQLNAVTTNQVVTLTFTGSNDQPVIEFSSNGTATEIADQTGQTGDVTATGTIAFSDIDGGVAGLNASVDTHSVGSTFISATHNINGGLSLAEIGALSFGAVNQTGDSVGYTWTAADNALDFLADGETLDLVYEVTITDDSGAANAASNTVLVTITVTGSNDIPVATADTGAITETVPGAAVQTTGDVLANDTDADGTDMLVVSAVVAGTGTPTGGVGSAVGGTYGTLELTTAGTWTYTLDPVAAAALNTDDEATDVFTYEVSDGKGGTHTATLTIDITGTNNPAVIAGDLSGIGAEDSAAPITGTATSADVDNDDNLFQ